MELKQKHGVFCMNILQIKDFILERLEDRIKKDKYFVSRNSKNP